MSAIAVLVREIAARHELQVGFLTNARREATPWLVDQPGLEADVLGDAFAGELTRRRHWCDGQCPGRWEVEGSYDEIGRRVGRLYRFETDHDAALFKLFFG